ncbi:MAG: hypothetical protein LUG18_06640 [Candidatus Azobacteroides sp.]|nr:hypothetical protein [Candidatus Azobacteroides sp.]
MRKLVVFAVLCISLLGLFSCLEGNEPVWFISNEPALVVANDDYLIVKTVYGRFVVPEVAKDTAKVGDFLWVSFVVDFGNQFIPNDTVATHFSFEKINTRTIKIQEGGPMNDTYIDTISEVSFYKSILNNVFFFEFKHRAERGQIFDYEIICNEDSLQGENKDIPALYIRSKKTITGTTENVTDIVQHFGFDMEPYLSKYKDPATNEVKLYINYLAGTNEDEDINEKQDVYATYPNYPITLKME